MASKNADRANPCFRFLRRMHAGGRSNMYGAIPYLSAAFGCGRDEAYRIVCEWLDQQQPAPAAAGAPADGVSVAASTALAPKAVVAKPVVPKARRKRARGRRG